MPMMQTQSYTLFYDKYGSLPVFCRRHGHFSTHYIPYPAN